ncbi:piwi-like protein Siwi [Dermatophagoides farinae]|uniref:piwi-like protein Siwi n=1 Tax=Dermatophagoides farinae TaxID=6954 RepID=UPI003F5E6211
MMMMMMIILFFFYYYYYHYHSGISLANVHNAQTVFNLSEYLARKNNFSCFNFASHELLGDNGGDVLIDRVVIKLCRTFNGSVNIVDCDYLNHQVMKLHCPSFDIGRTMVIGCYHRKEGQKSATGFWVSLDDRMNKAVKWTDGLTLEQMVKAMEQFKQTNDEYPNFIFLFRNLLSFERLPNVHFEAMISIIQDVMTKLDMTNTKLTCLLVEKKPRECLMKGSGGGTMYGTMAEAPFKRSLIVGYKSFCLFADNSNYGLKLLRPTKYHVIRDQMQLPVSVLAQFCFALCHYKVQSFFVNDVPVCLELADDMAKLRIQTMNTKEFMSLNNLNI